uniref:Outer membrane protein beta-barrel domain-containing protein n=1 Tax=viral metagenome TaxID=1070528 RepID=A0A6M3JQA0_9ZZZZ
MKKVMMLIVLMLSATAWAGNLNVWLYGVENIIVDSDSQEALGLRVGLTVGEEKNLEIGIASEFYVGDNGTDLPQVWSAYGLYYLPNDITVPQPIPLDWLPTELTARPYLGAQVGMDFDADGVISGPLAGVIIQKVFFAEYRYANYSGQLGNTLDDEHKLLFGLKWNF